MCGFCLEVTKQVKDYPKRCRYCKVSFCAACGSALKGKSSPLCYGCGANPPTIHAIFHRTGNFSAVYSEIGWIVRHRGAVAADGIKWFYHFETHLDRDAGKVTKRIVRCRDWPHGRNNPPQEGDCEIVRIVEEREAGS